MSDFKTSEIISDPKIGERLLDLRNRNKFCDIKIVVNEERIPAHKHVLASSSEYFDKIFNDESKVEVKIENMDLDIVQMLLDYCYTGNIRVSETNLQKIMLSAKIFKMTVVFNGCEEIFEKTINSSNYFSTWKWAELQHLKSLSKIVVEYGRQNYEKLSQLQEFLDLTDSNIVELLKSDIIVANEMIVFNSVKKWINHDKSRKQHVPELWQHIKFEYLLEDILSDGFLSFCDYDPSKECLNKIINAQKWKFEKPKLSDGNPRESYNTLMVVGSQYFDRSIPMEILDLNKDKWIKIEYFRFDKSEFAAVLLEHKLMLVGGLNASRYPVDTVQSYDLNMGTVENLPPMKYKRWALAAVEFKGYVYAIGGYNENHLAYVEMWDPVSQKWNKLSPMSIPRSYCEAKVLNEQIFVVGGRNENYLSYVESYNPVTDKWKKRASMNEMRYAPGIATIDNYLYAAGGWSAEEVYLMNAERYDPKIDKWTLIQSFEIAKCWMAAANFLGKFVTVGGATSNYQSLSAMEMYDDKKENWISMPSLNVSRYQLKAIEVPWRLANAVLSKEIPK